MIFSGNGVHFYFSKYFGETLWHVRANIENIRMTSVGLYSLMSMVLKYNMRLHLQHYILLLHLGEYLQEYVCKRPPYGQCNAIQDWDTSTRLYCEVVSAKPRYVCILTAFSYFQVRHRFWNNLWFLTVLRSLCITLD